ncbi:MAG: hypothetical protein AAB243_00350, partial [Planctomycetota bacterium]
NDVFVSGTVGAALQGYFRPTPTVFGLALIHKMITITLSHHHQTYSNTYPQTHKKKGNLSTGKLISLTSHFPKVR